MRMLFPLIGYFAVATLLTIGGGYAYMRQTGKLNDERMFQIVALLHGIDLQQMEEAKKNESQSEVPQEELSYEQQLAQLQEATLHFDVKQEMLASSLDAFDSRLRQLTLQTQWYLEMKDKVKELLEEQNKIVTDEALEKTVRNLELM
ncbi:MAG: hypothetical protein KDA61_11005, partial [Planctomycetales bacterium]|nr:hypothetical protein [Planctomycetales bacterium]